MDAHHHVSREGSLARIAASATAHCLTGCAIGEVLGLAIGTAVGLGDVTTVGLAIALAFFFGYLLTMVPLVRAGLALATAIPLALASDTFSIAVMEIVDNLIMVSIPGAMDAGLGDFLFWGPLALALGIAFVVAWPVNMWLIARGRGHAVVHAHHHGGATGAETPHVRPVRLALLGALAIALTAAIGMTAASLLEDDDEMPEHALVLTQR